MPECFVAKASEMQDGDRRIVTAGSAEIGVFYKNGDYFAYSNYCVHSGGPACEGLMINRVVDVIAPDRTYQGQTFSDDVHFVCPWHGYEFELKTGECVGDRRLRLKKFDGSGAATTSSSSLENASRRGRSWIWSAAKSAS
jgi:nitrite reductase/ring-hydroxylating ferredoxin subunit